LVHPKPDSASSGWEETDWREWRMANRE
jgi:hypothetical protein